MTFFNDDFTPDDLSRGLVEANYSVFWLGVWLGQEKEPENTEDDYDEYEEEYGHDWYDQDDNEEV